MAEVTKADIKDIYEAIEGQRIAISTQAITLMRIETLIAERKVWCADCQKEPVKVHLEEVRANARSIKDAAIAYVVQGLVSCCFMGIVLLIYNLLKG